MSTNPRSLTFDETGLHLMCELCFEWTDFVDLYVDAEGNRWDVCYVCGEMEDQ
jgi:hypothetical protein